MVGRKGSVDVDTVVDGRGHASAAHARWRAATTLMRSTWLGVDLSVDLDTQGAAVGSMECTVYDHIFAHQTGRIQLKSLAADT